MKAINYPVEQDLINPSQIEYLSDKVEELIHKIDLLSNVINKQTDWISNIVQLDSRQTRPAD